MQNKNEPGKIIAVCTSPEKGMIKHDVREGLLLEELGIEGDAHAGFMHRQVSLIAVEDIRTMMEKLPDLVPGSFAENLTTEGFDLSALKIGDRLKVGETILEVSQIGKECHTKCEVFRKTGDCIMPKKGIFTRVIKGGKVKTGDTVRFDN
ncbi:MAG: MOSC domain-containing protein [Synergistaceae bacterium]|nr:MOSC domain-containing protein [Synergistaceae bacterium]MDD4750400.1 MOSC domain-containing protein [Synergistaceae bacterium]MDD4837631.1 MOSC domain-containing protein [Synergistaceae bacterium]